MQLRLRRRLTAVGVAIVAALLVPRAAGAQEVPTITVTPSTGLVNGQVVSFTGTGFTGISSIAALECPPQFGGRTEFTITEVIDSCGFVATPGGITTDAAGNLTGSALVEEVFNASGGAIYDCTVRNDCVFLVAGLGGPLGLRGATTPIRFGPVTPTTTAQCKNSGWRSLANDQGEPFRNQGRCVSFVVSRRR
jgi:hypothetical protein